MARLFGQEVLDCSSAGARGVPCSGSQDTACGRDLTLEIGRVANELFVALLQASRGVLLLDDVEAPFLKINEQFVRRDEPALLPSCRVVATQRIPLVLHLGENVTLTSQLDLEVAQLLFAHLVLGLHELKLLLKVGQHLHGRRRLLAQFQQLFVALLDLLVERLILDLELLKVNQVQPIGELLLLAERRLELPQKVTAVDIREAHTLNLGILFGLVGLKLGDQLGWDWL